ncbi:MAG: ATP-binding cassette domain-containing protein, partial [Wenzhouxiangella sp.]|nr:ATP-binding cassette domain-containing protein [Wenzhouxiangella sp.]
QIGDGASGLSGGQRQRIALARALFRDPKMLILDEATSALDSITEARVYRQIEQLKATRIVIAHRMSTIRGADQILVMADGEIVERGRHEELMARGGRYQQMYTAQSERRGKPDRQHVAG